MAELSVMDRINIKCQFPVPEIGLNPGNAGLDRAFPQGFNLPAEGLVEDFRQCFAVCAVFGVDRPGLRQKIVRFLVDKFLHATLNERNWTPLSDFMIRSFISGPENTSSHTPNSGGLVV